MPRVRPLRRPALGWALCTPRRRLVLETAQPNRGQAVSAASCYLIGICRWAAEIWGETVDSRAVVAAAERRGWTIERVRLDIVNAETD